MATMRTMTEAAKARGKRAARTVGRVRAGVQAGIQAEGVEELRRRVAVLEDEVAQRDEQRVAAVLEQYSQGL